MVADQFAEPRQLAKRFAVGHVDVELELRPLDADERRAEQVADRAKLPHEPGMQRLDQLADAVAERGVERQFVADEVAAEILRPNLQVQEGREIERERDQVAAGSAVQAVDADGAFERVDAGSAVRLDRLPGVPVVLQPQLVVAALAAEDDPVDRVGREEEVDQRRVVLPGHGRLEHLLGERVVDGGDDAAAVAPQRENVSPLPADDVQRPAAPPKQRRLFPGAAEPASRLAIGRLADEVALDRGVQPSEPQPLRDVFGPDGAVGEQLVAEDAVVNGAAEQVSAGRRRLDHDDRPAALASERLDISLFVEQ